MFYRVTVFPLGLCTLIQRNIFFIRDLKLHRFCLWVRIGAHVCLESDCWYQWMHSDKFKLNSDKTECLLIGTRQQLQKVSNISTLSFGDSQIAPSCEVRNLGTWFDSKMSMLSHINKTCSSAFYYLYNMRRIRKYLSRSVTESLVHAFITSRVDYCNSLLYGPPEFIYHETPTDTECRSSVGYWNTKILPCYTIAFPPSLACDKLPYKV